MRKSGFPIFLCFLFLAYKTESAKGKDLNLRHDVSLRFGLDFFGSSGAVNYRYFMKKDLALSLQAHVGESMKVYSESYTIGFFRRISNSSFFTEMGFGLLRQKDERNLNPHRKDGVQGSRSWQEKCTGFVAFGNQWEITDRIHLGMSYSGIGPSNFRILHFESGFRF